MEMSAQATKLGAAENDLKELMADVTRAMEKAQDRRKNILQDRSGHNGDRLLPASYGSLINAVDSG